MPFIQLSRALLRVGGWFPAVYISKSILVQFRCVDLGPGVCSALVILLHGDVVSFIKRNYISFSRFIRIIIIIYYSTQSRFSQ